MSATAAPDPFTTKLTEVRCPYCDGALDAASHMSEAVRPKPGDLSVCLYCAQPLVFDAFLIPGKPAPGEVEAIFVADPAFADEVRQIQRAIRSVDRRYASVSRAPP